MQNLSDSESSENSDDSQDGSFSKDGTNRTRSWKRAKFSVVNQDQSMEVVRPGVKKSNNVWGQVLLDQTLTDSLVRGVKVERSKDTVERGSETYVAADKNKFRINATEYQKRMLDTEMAQYQDGQSNFLGSGTYEPDKVEVASESICSEKLPFSEASCVGAHAKSRKRKIHQLHKSRKSNVNGHAKTYVPVLSDTLSAVQVGVRIARGLQESKTNLIVEVVKVLGNKKAIQCFHRTKEIEATGGMLTAKGDRRKTPGGVFLTLAREDVEVDSKALETVFQNDKRRDQLKMKRRLKQQRDDTFDRHLSEARTVWRSKTEVFAKSSTDSNCTTLAAPEGKQVSESSVEEGECSDDGAIDGASGAGPSDTVLIENNSEDEAEKFWGKSMDFDDVGVVCLD